MKPKPKMKTNHSLPASARHRRPTWRYIVFCGWLVTCVAIVIAGQLASRKKGSEHQQPIAPRVGESAGLALSQQLENDNTTATVDEFVTQADSIPIMNGTDNHLETVSYNVDSPKGRVLIVRGIMTVFSLGLNDIGKALQNQGYDVRVTTVARSALEAKKMRTKTVCANDNAPVIIIGHSLGADRGPQLAALFAEENLLVDLMVLLDSTMPGSPPSNVRRCVNYYQSKSAANIFKGKQIDSLSKRTEVVNVNIQLLSRDETANINHFNIDSNPWIQQLLIGTVKNGTQLTTASEFKRYIDRFADQHIEPQNEIKSARAAEWSNLSNEPNRK